MKSTPYELVFGQPPRQNIFPGVRSVHIMEEDMNDLFDKADNCGLDGEGIDGDRADDRELGGEDINGDRADDRELDGEAHM